MKARVVMVLDNLAQVSRGISDIVSKGAYVGIPAEKNNRTDTPIPNAALGYLHETGVPERNIPARPWLVPGAATAKDKVVGLLKEAAGDALDGNRGAVESALNAAGLIGVSAVKEYLLTGPFAPLAPQTIRDRIKRRKYRVGEGIDRPLIDTGQMMRAVTYVIRDRK